ncbi:family 16 glycosylhydrolase [Zobellia nedashkovskayae]
MKNMKYYIGLVLTLMLASTSCQEDDARVGEIIAPTNVSIAAEIVGADADNPYGDGSGTVNFTSTADDEITYQFHFGDGSEGLSPTGEIEHRFSVTGLNTYTIVVNAVGTGGVISSTSMNVEVFSSFSDLEAVNMLAGTVLGETKTWYWASNIPTHVGLGPVEEDYGNGEFAYEAWWNSIGPWDEEKSCMYTNEFVFTRLEEGLTFEQTEGPAFIPGTYAGVIGVDGDTCHDESVATTMFGLKSVTFGPSTSKAALEGTYNEQPYRGTAFEISDGGFMGWYVGASSYDIISVTEDFLEVRIIEAGGVNAWYQKFTSTRPVEGEGGFESVYDNLIWADEFDVDGAPDPNNWGYDLGAGGWGNQESQTYTNELENARIEDGILKITAKADGTGGYTSARLKSENLQEFTYGRVEIRAKLPSSEGTWPAIWALGANFDTVGWPACGEIDIMEQTGNDKSTTLSTLHFTENFGGEGVTGSTEVTNSTSEFHNYTVEWTPDNIQFLVDDNPVHNSFDNTESTPFNDDFFFILNVAMGGTLGGTIDSEFAEDTMEIDYIRVYQ